MHRILKCPICGGDLTREDGRLFCPSGHSFDLAKEGYVNLLGGSASSHGDNKEMVKARRDFLEDGYYAPLAEAVARLAAEGLPRGGALLDAGSGEGYYTERLSRAVAAKGGRVYAFDVSKEAARLCAKRRVCHTFVASCYAIPVKDGAVNGITCLFAPLATEEFHRVLSPGGRLTVAVPAEEHLWEMKRVLYDTPYPNPTNDGNLPGFRLVKKESVKTEVSLPTQESIASLFAMTPYFYRTPRAGRERLLALSSLKVQASFHILTYEKVSM